MTILAGFAVNLTAFSSVFDPFLGFLGYPKKRLKTSSEYQKNIIFFDFQDLTVEEESSRSKRYSAGHFFIFFL